MSAERQAFLRRRIDVLKEQIADPFNSGAVATRKQGELIATEAELGQLVNAASELPTELVEAASAPPIDPELLAAISTPTVEPTNVAPTQGEIEAALTRETIPTNPSSESLQALMS